MLVLTCSLALDGRSMLHLGATIHTALGAAELIDQDHRHPQSQFVAQLGRWAFEVALHFESTFW